MKKDSSTPHYSWPRRGWLGAVVGGLAALGAWSPGLARPDGAPSPSPRQGEPFPRSPLRLRPAPHSVKRHG